MLQHTGKPTYFTCVILVSAACEKVARGKKNVSPVAPLGAPARKLLTTLEDLSNLDTYQVEMAVTPLNLTGRLPKIPKGTQDFGPARMSRCTRFQDVSDMLQISEDQY